MPASSQRSHIDVLAEPVHGIEPLQIFVGLWVGVATCYSAVIAMGGAHGLPVGFGIVSAIEIALLGIGAVAVVASGVRSQDWAVFVFFYFMVALTILLSIANERPLIEVIRTSLIISVFALLGQRMKPRTLDVTFIVITAVVLAVLILEVASTSSYVWLFQPQKFYQATRGLETSKYNSTGLFNTSSGFASRFSFGLFSDHRTGSIFLEQVGNANFACVLALYVMARWRSIRALSRTLCVVTVIAILVTTNARFASAMVVMLALGYSAFAKVPRALLPLVTVGIVVVMAVVGVYRYESLGDDMVGRIAHTVRAINEAGTAFLLGGNASLGLQEADSGYAYLIGSTSIFGLAALWLFVNYYPRANDAVSCRLNWGVVIYIFGQLVVSGTSLFSIKTAALLWILVGFVRVQPKTDIAALVPRNSALHGSAR